MKKAIPTLLIIIGIILFAFKMIGIVYDVFYWPQTVQPMQTVLAESSPDGPTAYFIASKISYSYIFLELLPGIALILIGIFMFLSVRKRLLRALVCTIYGVIIIVAGYGIFHGPSIFPLYADFYPLILAIMAAMVIFMMISSRGKPSMRILSRPDLARFAASLISGVYSSLMFGWCILKIMHGVMPFGMEPVQVGPFISNQFVVVYLLNLLIFAVELFRSIKDGVGFSVTAYVSLIVLNLEMIYEALLHEPIMGVVEAFMGFFLRYTATIYCVLLIVMAIRFFLNRKKGKD
ncbi:hypothetical protein [Butyrivibrio sp. AE3004]|uniref:hypothetical protein n=1 Tax=Butyrivibrio sp. AE3004 TaxID=1506994 RepID=UPI000494B016|nr:hypothetical protein [Butyrivibrio sp. AE3004]